MASEQTQLCLSWNTYSENIIQSLEANFSDSEFVDVTLTCKEETLKAHKVVLSACSSYLKQLLRVTYLTIIISNNNAQANLY